VSLRKKYVPAYVECLHSNNMGGDAQIEKMDAQLPEHTILVFRRLAHAKASLRVFQQSSLLPPPPPRANLSTALPRQCTLALYELLYAWRTEMLDPASEHLLPGTLKVQYTRF